MISYIISRCNVTLSEWNIVLLRIDDRYIHGQVTCQFLGSSGANEIWIICDKLANNPFYKRVQMASGPEGVKVNIFSLQEGIKALSSPPNLGSKVFIITSNPKDILELVRNGLKISWINVGNMTMTSDPNAKMIERQLKVRKEDVEAFKKLLDMGIRLLYQPRAMFDKEKDIGDEIRKA